jgi:hypothetical protein
VRGTEISVASLFSYTTEERYVHIFVFGERDKRKRGYFVIYLILQKDITYIE